MSTNEDEFCEDCGLKLEDCICEELDEESEGEEDEFD